ncbi:MAG: decaprenyl-phosphate phosphoribosyltransferase [Geopsychrobacter sp.]|nr:decaprenyl-phosphate phosphoribosyltransferase [Geopsychrobacter sp.]
MKQLWHLMRPHQWLKNLLLLFPPFLGGMLLQIDSFVTVALPLLSFSAAASSIYIFNDLMDLQQDSCHPLKCQRPLSSGKISKANARICAFLLGAGALFSASFVSGTFLFYLALYVLISIAYSWHLKTIPIVELFCVVSGFLLRLFAGGVAFNVPISDWLFLSVFLLALFLVAGKRCGETLHLTGESPELIRPVLSKYPQGFLSGCMYLSGAAVLVTYTMYVLEHPLLVYTVPLCCFGLLAYLLRVLSGQGGDPTRALLRDPLIFLVGVAWTLLVGWSIYFS